MHYRTTFYEAQMLRYVDFFQVSYRETPCKTAILNMRFVAPNFVKGKDLINSLVEKSVRNRKVDRLIAKLTMIKISKVYQTLYQINKQKILFLIIKKWKLSDNYFRKVLPLYY